MPFKIKGIQMQQQEKRWLTPEELYEKIRISQSTQAKMRMKNLIPYSKIAGKFIRYDLIKIDEWLEKNNVSEFMYENKTRKI